MIDKGSSNGLSTDLRGVGFPRIVDDPDETNAGDVTFIQRVNTTGGLRPTVPGIQHGEIKEVEYTAEYYFYKAENPNGN